MTVLYVVLIFVLIVILLFSLKAFQMSLGRKKAEAFLAAMEPVNIKNFGSVSSLSIIPLVDFYAENKSYATEEGTSFFIEADEEKILYDVGFNKKNEHPSPLLKNMKILGISPSDASMLFISHLHRDHIGGTAFERRNEFSLSAGEVKLNNIPVYAPDKIKPSKNNPEPEVKVITLPTVLGKGIASIGVYPRSLFLIGYTIEHSMVINLKGKGLVLIIGCGHQGTEAILDRVAQTFDEPLYAIIGGLHFPVNGGRVMVGPFNMQNIVGVDRKPWKGIGESNVESAIKKIKSMDPQIVAISAHDSSDWAINKFKEEFGERYRDIVVGKKIEL